MNLIRTLMSLGFEEQHKGGGFWTRLWDDTWVEVRVLGDLVWFGWFRVARAAETLEEVRLELPELEADAIVELRRLARSADHFDRHGRVPLRAIRMHG